jgi:hypothetical protein
MASEFRLALVGLDGYVARGIRPPSWRVYKNLKSSAGTYVSSYVKTLTSTYHVAIT